MLNGACNSSANSHEGKFCPPSTYAWHTRREVLLWPYIPFYLLQADLIGKMREDVRKVFEEGVFPILEYAPTTNPEDAAN